MSLDGNYDPENIFAKILRGEMPAIKVFESPHTLGIMDVFPQSKGHMLVIHKTSNARNLLDVDHTDLCQVMEAVQHLARAVKKALKPDGIIITQFNGAAAGQTVFHLHVHIIPRYESKALAGHASSEMADMTELQAVADQIKLAL